MNSTQNGNALNKKMRLQLVSKVDDLVVDSQLLAVVRDDQDADRAGSVAESLL